MTNIKNYKLIRSKRRSLSLAINNEAELIVRAPIIMPSKMIDNFIKEKNNWIRNKIDLVRERRKKFQSKKFIEGENFLFLGQSYKLKIIKNDIPLFFDKDFFLSNDYIEEGRVVFKNWYKKEAHLKILERAEYFSKEMDLKFSGFKISDATRKWGSCNSRDKINFSWRLIMAPLNIIDYVVIHELAHIRVKNHSRDFWNVVEDTLPSYKKSRLWLKENEYLLKI